MDWECGDCEFTNVAHLARCDLCDCARHAQPLLPAPSPVRLLSQPSSPRQPLGKLSQNEPLDTRLSCSPADSPRAGKTHPTTADALPASASPYASQSASPTSPPVQASHDDPEGNSENNSKDNSEDNYDGRFEWSEALDDANRCVFGASELRPLQRRAINAALSGRDVLVVMPTGAGKG